MQLGLLVRGWLLAMCIPTKCQWLPQRARTLYNPLDLVSDLLEEGVRHVCHEGVQGLNSDVRPGHR